MNEVKSGEIYHTLYKNTNVKSVGNFARAFWIITYINLDLATAA